MLRPAFPNPRTDSPVPSSPLGTRRGAMWRAMLFLSTTALVAACNNGRDVLAPEPAPLTPEPTVPTVVGTVRGTPTGDPVAGATVIIGSATTTTGADGRYRLTELTPGPATLSCTATGFEAFETDITVTSDSTSRDIVLTRRPAAGAVIGVYDLTASITSFDPAWGDLTGYGYAAVLTFRRDPGQPAGIGGTFSEFRVTGTEGDEDRRASGTITSYFDRGSVVLELVHQNGHFTLFPAGNVGDSVIEGTFFQGGHIGGPFTAERRQGE